MRNEDRDRLDDRLDNDRPNNDRLDDAGRRNLGTDEERITLAEEELAIGKRQTSAGEVEIEKRVETEHVRETVPVMRDEVTVERRPITDGSLGADADFREEHIRVPLSREEVVAEKRAHAAEEIVVRKHQVEDQQTVEADLRRERAEVHTEGNVHRADGTDRDLDGDGLR